MECEKEVWLLQISKSKNEFSGFHKCLKDKKKEFASNYGVVYDNCVEAQLRIEATIQKCKDLLAVLTSDEDGLY